MKPNPQVSPGVVGFGKRSQGEYVLVIGSEVYSKCFVPSEAQASEGGMDLVKAKAADIFPQPRVMSPANCRASEGESFRGKSLYSCTWVLCGRSL